MTQAIDMPASRSISMSAHAHANRILHPPSYILPTSSPHHTTKQGQDASSDSTKTNEEGTALVGSLGDLLGSLLVDLAHLRRQANGHVRAQMQSRVQGPAEPPSASTNGNPSGGSAPSTATNTNAGDANGKPPVGGVGAGLMGMGLGAVLPDVQGILGGRLGRGGAPAIARTGQRLRLGRRWRARLKRRRRMRRPTRVRPTSSTWRLLHPIHPPRCPPCRNSRA